MSWTFAKCMQRDRGRRSVTRIPRWRGAGVARNDPRALSTDLNRRRRIVVKITYGRR
jgi:hypothetical protein